MSTQRFGGTGVVVAESGGKASGATGEDVNKLGRGASWVQVLSVVGSFSSSMTLKK